MNPKPWLPLIAFAVVGAHSLAASAAQIRVQMRGTRVRTSDSADARIDAMGPSQVWSSMASRMIHVVDESSMIMITAFFVAGMVSILIGV